MKLFAFQPPKESDGPASAEIRELVKADQADRQFKTPPTPEEWKPIAARDKQRRERMREILLTDKLVTGDDFGGAFLLFQHGEKPDDYLVAHECAVIAQTLLRNLSNSAALAEDRFLDSVGRKQRFGSQFDMSGKEVKPVSQGKDTDVTDGLRMDYFCPSLEAARKGAMIPDQAAIDQVIERVKPQMDPEWRKKIAPTPDANQLMRLPVLADDAKGEGRDLWKKRDAAKRVVLRLYRADKLNTPTLYLRAAEILRWSWRGAGELDVLLLAHELAVVAMFRNEPEAGKTAAATIDHYLAAIKQPQRFGTAIRQVRGDGKVEPPIAPTVTDTIRAKFGIAPLKELILTAREHAREL